MNHSVLMSDPLSKARLVGGPNSEIGGFGIGGLFTNAHLHDWSNADHVTVVHLICPAPTFTDRGKTTIAVPPSVGWRLGDAVWAATRKVYQEHAQAVKDARRQERQAQKER